MESRESVFIVSHSQEELRLQGSPVREKKHISGFDSDDGDLCSPTGPKRRRIMNEPDTPSSMSSEVSSRSDSPTLYDYLDDSNLSSPGASPSQTLEKYKKRYKKDELWSAIKKNYQFIMDSDIINTCQTPDGDLSPDDEDYDTNSSFSYTEFVQQYRELSDWLCKLQKATSCKTMGLTISEKYLYQSWHEEMMKKSSRLKLFNEYAMQLEQRYPNLKSEIKGHLQYLNGQWHEVEKGIDSKSISQDPVTMLKDLEADLGHLRDWLDKVEDKLSSLSINPLWSMEELECKLTLHQELQRDIESHSQVVSAILKLSERLQNDAETRGIAEEQESPDVAAVTLQKRWHSVWLQSLEWQCRLEDVINKKKGNHETSPFCDDEFAVKDDSYLDLSAYGVEDSFTFESGFRGDVAFSPGISDSSTTYSPGIDKPSGKDSACASEGELKLSDMSEHVDLSLSTGSDSDLDINRRLNVRLDSKDIGYGSESHSNEETEMKKFRNIAFNSIGSLTGKQDVKYDIYRMTIDIESTDKTDGDEGEVNDNITGSRESLSHDKNIAVGGLASEHVSTEESTNLNYDNSPKEDIKFLIDQVDSVYRESSPFHERKREHVSISSGDDSCRPIMVDANVGTTSVVESSCDASGEDTSDSDNADEFSTATDDGADTLFDSVICLDYTSDSKNTSRENICLSTNYPPLFDTSRLRKHGRHGRTKERPWSVVELKDTSKGIDLQVFSTSESAINRLAGNHSDSETPSKSQHLSYKQQSSTFPRERTTHSSFQRTFSASEQSSSSPVHSKRKLQYSYNSSGHTDTASGSHHNVPSTSDDDTNICSETEKLLQKLQNAKMKTSSSSYDTDSENLHGSTTDEYLTPMEIMISDVDDLMNSGASFSETAWDNYQAPLYPTVSEDPSEEPLQWEPVDELEFDDEITLGHKSILADVIQRRKSPEKKTKPTSFSKDMYDDSDSDKEDLCCLIDESLMSLKVADRSLRKKRKDPLGTGLNLNPNKYGEILATCDTNIECLKKIQHHLSASNVTDDEIQQLSELLYEWEKVQALATERQAQSHELKEMYATLLDIQGIIQDKHPDLLINVFKSPEELSATVKSLQSHCSALEAARSKLKTLEEQAITFTSENSIINMYNFLQQLQQMEADVEEECKRFGGHLLELETAQKKYFEYLFTKQELDSILSEERDLLQRLAFKKEINIPGSDADFKRDVKCLVKDLALYEEKLTPLEAIHCHLTTVFTGPTQVQMKAGLADIRNQLLVIKRLCKELLKCGVIMSEEEDVTAIRNIDSDNFSKVDKSAGQKPKPITTWLQSRPVQTSALFVLLGLLYWANPDLVDKIANFSIQIAPDFRYVDGPPPV